jgi:hypothetical protein
MGRVLLFSVLVLVLASMGFGQIQAVARPSGAYFYSLATDGALVQTKKMVLLK